jgi:hypothetical protein
MALYIHSINAIYPIHNSRNYHQSSNNTKASSSCFAQPKTNGNVPIAKWYMENLDVGIETQITDLENEDTANPNFHFDGPSIVIDIEGGYNIIISTDSYSYDTINRTSCASLLPILSINRNGKTLATTKSMAGNQSYAEAKHDTLKPNDIITFTIKNHYGVTGSYSGNIYLFPA